MNIKNYTTTVPADKSVQNIEKLLIDAGAIGINKTINPGTKDVEGIVFQMMIEQKPLFFKMEVTEQNINAIYKIITQGKRLTNTQRNNYMAQAKRIAWKLLHEELAIKISRVKLQQMEMARMFLPEVCDPITGKTLFETLKESGFRQLTEGK